MSQTSDCLGADIQGKTKTKKKFSTCLKIIKTRGKKRQCALSTEYQLNFLGAL